MDVSIIAFVSESFMRRCQEIRHKSVASTWNALKKFRKIATETEPGELLSNSITYIDSSVSISLLSFFLTSWQAASSIDRELRIYLLPFLRKEITISSWRTMKRRRFVNIIAKSRENLYFLQRINCLLFVECAVWVTRKSNKSEFFARKWKTNRQPSKQVTFDCSRIFYFFLCNLMITTREANSVPIRFLEQLRY